MTREQKIDFVADRQAVSNINSLKFQEFLSRFKDLEVDSLKNDMSQMSDKEVDVLYDFFASHEEG